MVALSPCLRRLFNEIDAVWPHRNHGIDGWLRWPSEGISVGHNPGHNDLVHAIDVDRRGIWPEGIIINIEKRFGLRYMIWNRHIYHRRDNWEARPYTLSNPHTDHIHIEIDQTDSAEQYAGSWNLAALTGGDILGGIAGVILGGGSSGGGDVFVSQGIGTADDRNYTAEMAGIALRHRDAATSLAGIRNNIISTRNL